MEELVTEIIQTISGMADKEKRFIVGIDGLSRSGKTTLVNHIRKMEEQEGKLTVLVFHLDDYIVEQNKRYNTSYEEWYEYYYLQWDINSLKESLFQKLKVSEQVTLQLYEASHDTHSTHTISLPENCLIIVEGVFLQRKEWRDYFDFVIYLDCPREIRFKRESENTQKNIEKFQNRYWKAEDFYLDTVFPKAQANMVLKS
ncbi:kinase [Bacillus sp. CGMCC 1.16607]|uniref:kinase n=1 Tax=Bacillus sp. CGMCC 1.16607 TaxID=3351842 RepID=UPI00362CF89F